MNTLIIPAAGGSTRMGGKKSKVFIEIKKKPVLAWALEPAAAIRSIGRVIVAAPENDVEEIRLLLDKYGWKRALVVAGGASRAESVWNALQAAGPPDKGLVIVHDAARPCASVELWKRVISAAKKHGAAIPVTPVTDTIKTIDEKGFVKNTLNRSALASVQTPQAFDAVLLADAYRKAGKKIAAATDDAAIMEMAGHKVFTVEGELENIKLTREFDMTMISRHLKD